jgi:hypothetical protein
VEVGQFTLEKHEWMVRAGYVARSAGAGTHAKRRLDHVAHDLGMLSHPKVVIGAPDNDVTRAIRRMPNGARESSCHPLKLDEITIAGALRGGEQRSW